MDFRPRHLAPVTCLLALALLRVFWFDALPVNSDEPQHAHVAWAWTQGWLPYRDVFDNHGPLFGWLYAPLLHALDGRVDVLFWLRAAVLPWYLLALWAVWRLGSRLYPAPVAGAATLLAALSQVFFFKSMEFRTDDAWAALWLLALMVALGARGRWARWFLAGFLAGAALSVSQKTLLLLATASLASVATMAAPSDARPRDLRRAPLLAALAGGLVVPGAFVAWFALHHALGALWYGVAGYGLADGGGVAHPWRVALYFVLAPGLVVGVRRRLAADPAAGGVARGRAFLGLHAALHALLIWLVWPLVTPQDFLPVIPLVFLVAVGAVAARLHDRPAGHARRWWLVALAAEVALLIHHAPPWRDAVAPWRRTLATVLRYTDPGDTVMDAKSGAVFRARPYYPVLETMALRALRSHAMPDSISAVLVSHRTRAVIPERLPDGDLAFVRANYLPAPGDVWLAGKRLVGHGAGDPVAVPIAIAGRYTLVADGRPVEARMDGGVRSSSWQLGVGAHMLTDAPEGTLFLIWSQAWERGWRP